MIVDHCISCTVLILHNVAIFINTCYFHITAIEFYLSLSYNRVAR